jgi:hypothetical protein
MGVKCGQAKCRIRAFNFAENGAEIEKRGIVILAGFFLRIEPVSPRV